MEGECGEGKYGERSGGKVRGEEGREGWMNGRGGEETVGEQKWRGGKV